MSAPPLGLQDKFDLDGLWWTLDKAEDQVAGTLSVGPDGNSLQLFGIHGELTGPVFAASQNQTLHGFTMDGKPVSLLNAWRNGRQLRFPGIPTDRYYVGVVILGLHITSVDEELFDVSWARFDKLETWLGSQPFGWSIDQETRKFGLEADVKKIETLAIVDGMKVRTGANLYTESREGTGFGVTVHSLIGVETDNPKSLQWHIETLARLRELASLCTGHPLSFLALEVTRPPMNDDGTIDRSNNAQVYFRMRDHVEEKVKDSVIPLVAAQELVLAEPRAFELWFEQHALLEPAMHLYFSVTGTQSMFVNVRFLLAIQALEVFHRRTMPEGIANIDVFKKVRDTLIGAIPDDAPQTLREKLRAQLGFANEPSLMQRLRAIIGLIEAEFGERPAGIDDRFARSLVDTRNYYTHFSEALKEKCLDVEGMHWATRRIVMLLTVLILMRLGMKSGHLRQVLGRHQEFEQLWARPGRPF